MTETPRPEWDTPALDAVTDPNTSADNAVKVRNAFVSVQPTT